MKRAVKSRRAISPLIATIILVSITIAGGLLIYNVFFSAAGTLMAKGQVEVEAVDLVKDTEGDAVFTITIKNTGNKPVTALAVTLAGETEASIDLSGVGGNLQPSQSVSHMNDALAGSYVSGNSYNVVIEATFSDSSTFISTISVKCRTA
ncbi:MAG: archaellin/type IV pilin N-terminal domain-containing protein [Candidatus Jordarchaeales archaeon]